MGTFIVGLILLAVIIGSTVSLIRDRKRGKCSCGGSCGSCGACALCADQDGGSGERSCDSPQGSAC